MGIIRDMTIGDIDRVLRVEQTINLHPWDRGMLEQALRLDHWCPVVEEAEEIVGYGVANLTKGHGRLIGSVSPNASIVLYKEWFERSKKHNVDKLYAEIDPENEKSIGMLKHFGFEQGGIKPHFYSIGKHANVYIKKLT